MSYDRETPAVPESANSRLTAARILQAWMDTGEFPSRLLDPVTQARAFITEVVFGAVRWKAALDWVIAHYVGTSPDPLVRAILMTGIYQLLFMETVPAFAAVHETAAAAREAGAEHAVGFINGVLRRLQRERGMLLAALKGQELPVRESHPAELVRRWVQRYGPEQAESLCRWDNRPPEIVLHVNTLRGGVVGLAARLEAAGFKSQPHPALPSRCLVAPRGVDVRRLPGFAEGLFTVCDPSTITAVACVGAQPGETILDACAAPGGKSALLAQQMRDEGRLVAMDVSGARAARIRDTVQRLGLHCVVTAVADAAEPAQIGRAAGGRLFDRVLLDAPCTNTGVLRRRPDARWRFSPEYLGQAVARQQRLLAGVACAVRPGGTLVYSTCSLEPEENQQQIAAWLKSHSEFSLVNQIALFPPASGTDGAFCAVLRRKT